MGCCIKGGASSQKAEDNELSEELKEEKMMRDKWVEKKKQDEELRGVGSKRQI
jgi:hypothetical protein